MTLTFEQDDGEAPLELNALELHGKKTACPDIVQDRPDGENGDAESGLHGLAHGVALARCAWLARP